MAKTISFGVVHMSVAFSVGYLMTGSVAVGGALALVEPGINTVAYYFHEKVWARRSQRVLAQPSGSTA
jgi:uncharacterized membrane protein